MWVNEVYDKTCQSGKVKMSKKILPTWVAHLTRPAYLNRNVERQQQPSTHSYKRQKRTPLHDPMRTSSIKTQTKPYRPSGAAMKRAAKQVMTYSEKAQKDKKVKAKNNPWPTAKSRKPRRGKARAPAQDSKNVQRSCVHDN